MNQHKAQPLTKNAKSSSSSNSSNTGGAGQEDQQQDEDEGYEDVENGENDFEEEERQDAWEEELFTALLSMRHAELRKLAEEIGMPLDESVDNDPDVLLRRILDQQGLTRFLGAGQ